MRTRHRREDLERLVAQRDSENLTFRELSERSGIPMPTLGYWAAKLCCERTESAPTIVPLEVASEAAPAPLVVDLGRDLRVVVERNFNAAHLARVVRALTARC